jgi:hypothetical protein
MTDYRDDRRANARAHRLRWWVWGFLPLLFLLFSIYTLRNELAFLFYTEIFWRFYQ